MLLFGLLLLGATAAFTGLLIADNLSGGPDYSVVVLGNTIATMNGLEIFLSGVALALIFCLGLAMTRVGGQLARRRRTTLGEARRTGETPIQQSEPWTAPAVDERTGASTPAHAGRPRRHLFGH
ncbi:hypothetical protein [Streptacidiphilus pinicola]|uniref:hypothetical protein n=1 Tax=Streptacidiphilus pinicola TaxID=2219663 RepID=UPI001FB53CA5|nr:hypothetical protein [Streptacidiphilus pinicola]